MKIKNIILYSVCVVLLWSCKEESLLFAPDRLFPAPDGNGLLIANRNENELILLKEGMLDSGIKVRLNSPVNDLVKTPDGSLWVVCDGYSGKLYELDATSLTIKSEMTIGNSPSAISYNPLTKSLWVTQRFTNKLLEIDPVNKEIKNNVEVGREPVDMISFAGDSLLLVANNLPEMAALDFPVASRLTIIDVLSKQVNKRIILPNGSTDVKSIAITSDRSYAYVTHLIARYQLPTNQVDRGWMSTNALSIIDLDTKELMNTVLLDTPQKGTANPWGVAVSDDDRYIVVAASGVHELVKIDRDALHERLALMKDGVRVTPSSRKWEDIPNDAGFLYGISVYIPTKGKGPRSVISSNDSFYAANYFTGEIIRLAVQTEDTEITQIDIIPLVSTREGEGNMYFHDATIGFQGWQSCASCHPNEARIDGLNWDLLNDGIGNPKNTKSLLYSHQTPPCMATGIRKDAETAVRSGLKYILFAEPNEDISKAMDIWLRSLTPEPSPYLINGHLSQAALRGKKSFDQHCASCHSGKYYTNGKLYEVDWTVGSEKGKKMDVPHLNELWRTAPYLYDGRSYTIHGMLKIHGPETVITDNESKDLEEYLLSL